MNDDQTALLQELILGLFRLDDALKAAANRITQPAGQTGARWQVLNALADGPKTVAGVARVKNAARQGVQRIVNELTAEGIAEALPNPKHSRYPLIALTGKGADALKAIQAERRIWLGELSANLACRIDRGILRFIEDFTAAVEKTLP